MLQNLTEWDEKVQSQLHVNQRIANTSKLQRKEYNKDKRNLVIWKTIIIDIICLTVFSL